jgi:threonine dehydrogenase-like Zn-dependent dehydrogenase
MVEFTVFKGSKDGKVVKSSTKKDLRPDEVLIKVTHSGLCGTDEHYKTVDMALGHEGAGIVEVSSKPLLEFSNLQRIENRCIRDDIPRRRLCWLGLSA